MKLAMVLLVVLSVQQVPPVPDPRMILQDQPKIQVKMVFGNKPAPGQTHFTGSADTSEETPEGMRYRGNVRVRFPEANIVLFADELHKTGTEWKLSRNVRVQRDQNGNLPMAGNSDFVMRADEVEHLSAVTIYRRNVEAKFPKTRIVILANVLEVRHFDWLVSGNVRVKVNQE